MDMLKGDPTSLPRPDPFWVPRPPLVTRPFNECNRFLLHAADDPANAASVRQKGGTPPLKFLRPPPGVFFWEGTIAGPRILGKHT